jgi:hypothetical protein
LAAHELIVDPESGALTLTGLARISAGQTRAALEPELRPCVTGQRDHRNGYAWLMVGGLTFGGLPCSLGICFHDGAMSEAGWNLRLPDAALKDGWPTRETSDREVAFCRQVLAGQLGRDVPEEGLTFPWGRLWCAYDDKGGTASTGLRYES